MTEQRRNEQRHDDEHDQLDPLDKAVGTLDWARCVRSAAAKSRPVTDIADHFDHSNRLVCKYPNAALETKRQAFVQPLLATLQEQGESDAAQHITTRLSEGRLLETCFHGLLTTLPSTPAGALPPEVHAWAIVERLVQQQKHVAADVLRTLRARKEVFDPLSMLVDTETGEAAYDPDSILSRLSGVAASSLVMLGIQNGWIRADRFVVLPKRPTLSQDDIDAAGITEYLGNVWGALDHLEKRWRFFGGTVDKGTTEVADAEAITKTVECVRYLPEYTPFEFVDHVATERLNRYILQNLSDLAFQGNVNKRLAGARRPVAPAPQQYVSTDEAFAAVALSSLLHFNVLEDEHRYGGLRFSAWIRGYAWLKDRSSTIQSDLQELTRSNASAELAELGLAADDASTLLDHLSLGTEGGDLFDTPLIQVEGDSVVYHAVLVKDLNIPRAILSRLSALRVQIAPKGRAFEGAVLTLFRKHGLRAEYFKFERDGEEYQFDAVVLWDDVLFVFEDKSYSLPLNDPLRLYWFSRKMADGMEQVLRLTAAVQRYPDEIRQRLGVQQDYEWKSVVPCVLNSLPWSAGKVGDVYICDFSAIGRFLDTRTAYVKIPLEVAGARVLWRHHLKDFWSGSAPTPASFLEQLESPWQLRSLATTFAVQRGHFRIAQDLAFETAFVRRAPADRKRMLEAAGIEDPADELDAIQGHVRRLKAGLTRRAALRSVKPRRIARKKTNRRRKK